MRYLVARALTALAIVSVLPAAPVRAESFAVTGGHLVFDYEGDFFRWTGDSFMLHLTGDQNYGRFVPRELVAPCRLCNPGDVVNTSFSTPGEVALGSGNAFVNGQYYEGVSFRGSLSFDVTPVRFPDSREDFVRLSAPFSASGFMRVRYGGNEVASGPLSGFGRTFQPFFPTIGGYEWEEGRLDYVFRAGVDPAPVPEPATMMLMGVGLLGTAWRVRQRNIVP
jgi:hypothetical protein